MTVISLLWVNTHHIFAHAYKHADTHLLSCSLAVSCNISAVTSTSHEELGIHVCGECTGAPSGKWILKEVFERILILFIYLFIFSFYNLEITVKFSTATMQHGNKK